MVTIQLFLLVALLSHYAISASILGSRVSKCSTDVFHFPLIHGAESIAISADEVYNFTAFSLMPGTSTGGSYSIDFCNVTVTYSHPGWNDQINVQVWLPLVAWNNRLQALGGGGYSAGFGSFYLTQAVAEGYAAVDTDAGHESGLSGATSPHSWALTSKGNVNLYLLQDFASRSLEEIAIIGKAVVQDFYGVGPRSSYFIGCSGGGRQGLEIAQRYPDMFDGILAAAPAISIDAFIPAAYWAHQVMKTIGYHPPPCEVQAFTSAAIQACDGLDGVEDNIISQPHLCNFTAHGVVGRNFSCNGSTRFLTKEAADIVHAAWIGPRSPTGNINWPGLNKDTSLISTYITTQCDSDNNNCRAVPSDLLAGWFKYFLARDPNFDPTSMTTDQFFKFLKLSQAEYHSSLGSSDPDLTNFRASGGKMISWHGLADETIPPRGSSAYYDNVLRMDSNASDFYRHFEAPGVGHCIGGTGPMPNDAFQQLVAWVEDGILPDTLIATGVGSMKRPLCPYPSVQSYIGGAPGSEDSFECVRQPRESGQIMSFSDHIKSSIHLQKGLG